MVYVVSFEGFKEYVGTTRCIFYRIYDGEIRIYAGRVGTVVNCNGPDEKTQILEYLKKLEATKTVLKIEDVTNEEMFFV